MSECTTFYRMLKDNADKWGNKEAVLYDTISVTYKGLFDDVVKKAIHLKRFEGREIAIYDLHHTGGWLISLEQFLLAKMRCL